MDPAMEMDVVVRQRLSARAALDAFCSAQRAYAAACRSDSAGETARQSAFRRSAVAASLAVESGLTLGYLADQNRQASKDLATRGVLYVGKRAVAYHALTGDLLQLPESPQHPPVVPTEAQSLVCKVQVKHSVPVVKAILKKCTTQGEAVSALADYLQNGPPATDKGPPGSRKPTRPAHKSNHATESVDDLLRRLSRRLETEQRLSDEACQLLAQIAGQAIRGHFSRHADHP
jgi:hypothetical protein